MTITSGTSGGRGGLNGAQRRLIALFAGGFAVILIGVMIANAESMLSDLASAGVRERGVHVWSWEATSIVAWISVMPAIWWMVRRAQPPRFSWAMVALTVAAASIPVSAAHIGLMIALRKLVYAAMSEEYHFFGVISDRLLYEYRKDVPTYLQFTALIALLQWLVARAATPAAAAVPTMFSVADGAVTHQVPIAEIDHVAAAGNYVEIASGARILLHRATLAAVADTLGPGFVRIHRSRLVRRDAVRRIESDKSGDFTVELHGGQVLRGSRRYRDGLRDPSQRA